MNWLYLSLGSVICYTCLNIFSRLVSVDSKNPRALSFAFNLVSIFMAVVLFLLTSSYKNLSLPVKAEGWLYLLIASFFFGIFERLRFFATKLLDISTYSIISNITVIVAFAFSLFLYSETLSLSKSIGFLLILASLFLVVDRKKSKVNIKGLIVGLSASFAAGIGMGLDKIGATFFNPEVHNVLLWIIPFIVVFFPYIKINDIIIEFKKFSWKILLLAFFNFSGYYFGLKAFFLVAGTMVVFPIIQTTTIITVMAGIFLFKEKNNLFKKILSGVIAVIGVFLLR